MRRLFAGVAIAALLCGQSAVAQEIMSGFPPGVFQNTAAMAGSSCTPSSLSLDFTTGSFPPVGVTDNDTTGGTGHNDVGTYFNSSNVLVVNSAGRLRPDYELVGSTRTVLYEPAATNKALQSNAFSTTWAVGNSETVTAAAGTSPDGTNDAWNFVAPSSSFGVVNQFLTLSNVSYVLSAYVKSNGNPGFQLQIDTSGGVGQTATASWVRYFQTQTSVGGSTRILGPSAFGSPALNVLGFGAQLETAASTPTGATSYIPTTTTAITRAADSMTFTVPACAGHITVTFDNNATQSIAVSPGSYTLTTALTRPNIKSIVGAI